MDPRAVRAATRLERVSAAAAAARNAGELVRDAEILAQAHRTGRAYFLAALAVEEVGKALGLAGLAGLPEALLERAPIGRMLQWHQLKQAAGQLVGAVPYGPPGLAARLLDMPQDDLTQILSTLKVPGKEAGRLKRVGLYVDIGRGGHILKPAEVTEAEAADQLARARLSADAASMLLDPAEQARVVHPPEEGIEFFHAVIDALAESGYARTPDAAADVIIKAVCKLRETMTVRFQYCAGAT